MITAPCLSFSHSFSGNLLPTDLHRPSSSSSPPIASLRSPRATASASASYAAEKERESAPIPMAVATATSLYEVLGVPTEASGQEIKAAYRRLARACHPDVVAVDRKDMSTGQFMRVHDAYSTLSDPEKRADYDRGLLKASNRRVMYRSSSFSSAGSSSSYSYPSSPRSSFSGFTTRRTWETDQCW